MKRMVAGLLVTVMIIITLAGCDGKKDISTGSQPVPASTVPATPTAQQGASAIGEEVKKHAFSIIAVTDLALEGKYDTAEVYEMYYNEIKSQADDMKDKADAATKEADVVMSSLMLEQVFLRFRIAKRVNSGIDKATADLLDARNTLAEKVGKQKR